MARGGMRVESVDAVGAGDSFDAGFIHRFLKERGPEECLRIRRIAGAYSTTHEGGTEAFRDRDALDAFFRKHSESELNRVPTSAGKLLFR